MVDQFSLVFEKKAPRPEWVSELLKVDSSGEPYVRQLSAMDLVGRPQVYPERIPL